MSVSVTMPRLGESVTEGTVTRWLKQEGEQVQADEPLLEVSTDKVDTEVPSPASGVLASIKVAEDETVDIGVELAIIGDDSGSAEQSGPAEAAAPEQPAPEPPAPEPQATQEPTAEEQTAEKPTAEQPTAEQPAAAASAPSVETAEQNVPAQPTAPETQRPAAPPTPPGPPTSSTAEPAPEQPSGAAPPDPQPAAAPWPTQEPGPAPRPGSSEPADEGGGAYVTPLVRKLAGEQGVDLSTVTGTGVGGRIRKSDVLAAATPKAPAQAPPAPAATAPAAASPSAGLRGRTEKLTRRRSLIAARMVESLQTAAQLTTVVEADVTRIARLRDAAKADFQAREGVKLSFLPFFALAAVEALKAHPVMNSSIDTDAGTVTYHDAVHLGIAVDAEAGLTVPVIHGAGDLNLGGVARKIADLADRTRNNKISPDELSGMTFSITNTGSRGALFDTPIFTPPQVGILGTGAVVKRAVVVTHPDLGETIAIRSMVYLALSYDHRIVDGADAARFLATVKERLEAGAFEAELGQG